MNTLSFVQDDSGAWGYKVGGADTVNPFKQFSIEEYNQSYQTGYDAGYANGYNIGYSDGSPKTVTLKGTVELSTGPDPGNSAYKDVLFSTPFVEKPTVSISNNNTGQLKATYSNVTKLGFRVTVVNEGGAWYPGCKISWTAVGKQ